MTTHRPPMSFLKRDGKFSRAYVHPQTRLLPRILFKGRADVLDSWDRMAKLQAEVGRYSAAARELTAQAAGAKQQYARDVREAMATGVDPDTVINAETVLLEQAQQQQELADEARRGATAHGYVLGELLAQAAPDLLAPSEKTMGDAHRQVLDAVANLEQQWSKWSAAWHVRRILSSAWLFGGSVGGYKDETPLPAEVTAALATLTAYTQSLDKLKADEAEVLSWRAQEEKATAANARMAQAAAPRTGTFMSI